jgi:hypothetical protein
VREWKPVVNDAVRQDAGYGDRTGKEDNSKKTFGFTHERQPPGLVRVCRYKLKVETVHAP